VNHRTVASIVFVVENDLFGDRLHSQKGQEHRNRVPVGDEQGTASVEQWTLASAGIAAWGISFRPVQAEGER